MTVTPPDPPILPGLGPVADRYDGFILDLWGVLHDGVEAFPGVIDGLTRLRRAGKRICLLSNAPRRVTAVKAKLDGLGIEAGLYDHLMTSGEAVWRALSGRDDAVHRHLGARYLHIGPPRDDDVVEGLPLEETTDPAAADFVLCTGIDDDRETVADYEPVLAATAERRLPMICANPDLIVIIGGKAAVCAGLLAQRYEALGGTVIYHGKPHAPVYDHCLGLLGIGDRRRILAVGDSFHTDIAGAAAAGIESAFVTGGIHREALGTAWGEAPAPAAVAALAAASGGHPTLVIPRFAW
jgi:HAD superfamily hydrolase (TIGR01459 family)